MATVEAVCTSDKKGTVKQARGRVTLMADWGIDGDAHAGAWHRQVSLLAAEAIESVRLVLPDLEQGAFAENIITSGIALESLGIGSRVRIGATAVLEITQIGKECHNSGCAIKKATGDCIMPRQGLFAKVIEGGAIGPGDEIVRL